jgi:hypothetical protein
MLRISGQNLLGENPSLDQPPLPEIKIRQAGFQRGVVRILLQPLPDLFLRLPIFPALFKGPDVIGLLGERRLPLRFQGLLERWDEEILMKLVSLCKGGPHRHPILFKEEGKTREKRLTEQNSCV